MLVLTGALKMQFMTLFSWHPDRGEKPAPADLREAEFEMIRDLYAVGLVRQIWLRGDAGGACAIVEAASSDEVAEVQRASFHPRRLPAASDDRSTEAVFRLRSPKLMVQPTSLRKICRNSMERSLSSLVETPELAWRRPRFS